MIRTDRTSLAVAAGLLALLLAVVAASGIPAHTLGAVLLGGALFGRYVFAVPLGGPYLLLSLVFAAVAIFCLAYVAWGWAERRSSGANPSGDT